MRGPARSRFLGTSQEPWVTGRGRRPDFDRNPCRAPGPGAGATLTGVASGSWSEPPAFLSVGQERSQLSGLGRAPWPLGPQPGPRFLGRLPVWTDGQARGCDVALQTLLKTHPWGL